MVQSTDLKMSLFHFTVINMDQKTEDTIVELLRTLNGLCQKLVENQRAIISMQAQTHNQLVIMCLDGMYDDGCDCAGRC